jgi:lactobin A/cerein 7B family class IIb bacteriocin
MGIVSAMTNDHDMCVLSDFEISQVSGGVVPLAVAIYYSAGFVTGVGAGWSFASLVFRIPTVCAK